MIGPSPLMSSKWTWTKFQKYITFEYTYIWKYNKVHYSESILMCQHKQGKVLAFYTELKINWC